MSDPNNLICGVTIVFTPIYLNDKIRMSCRAPLWEGDEINGKFKSVLEGAGIQYLSQILKDRLALTSYLRVCTEARGDEDTDDDGTRIEVFVLDIDVFGDPAQDEAVIDVVTDDATCRILCKKLRVSSIGYITEVLPDVKLNWKIEVSDLGYG